MNCTKCGVLSPGGANFCQACGATLGATMVQGRTVVAAAGPAFATPVPMQGPQVTVRTIWGNGPSAPPGLAPLQPNQSQQRELTELVLDVSGSMGENYDGRLIKLDAAVRAAGSMVLNKARIDPLDEIGIIAFNGRAWSHFSLSPVGTTKRQLLEALQSLRADDGTDINEGLKAARDALDWSRGGVVRRIVLLTDGHGGEPLHTADDLKARGVVIDVVGVGPAPSNVNERLLKQIASVVQGELRYRFITDHQTLIAHYTQLANKTAIGA